MPGGLESSPTSHHRSRPGFSTPIHSTLGPSLPSLLAPSFFSLPNGKRLYYEPFSSTVPPREPYSQAVPAKRFPFRIDLVGIEAVVTMDCGRGVHRARCMPIPFLRTIANFCRRSDSILDPLRQPHNLPEHIPALPNCLPLGSYRLGPCTAVIVVSRDHTPTTELSIAFYDTDDTRAPALLLTEEQIANFVRKVDAILPPPLHE